MKGLAGGLLVQSTGEDGDSFWLFLKLQIGKTKVSFLHFIILHHIQYMLCQKETVLNMEQYSLVHFLELI